MDLDAYVLAHWPEWARLEQLRQVRPAHRAGERRARRALPAGRDPPVRGPYVGAGRVARRAPLVAASPRPQQGRRHPGRHLARRPHLLLRAVPGGVVPAALVVARLPRGQRGRDRGDDVVAARPPDRRADPALAGRGRPAGQQRLRELLQRVRRQPLRGAGLGQQRLGVGALHRARHPRPAGALPAVQQHPQPRGDRLGDDPPRPGRPVLGADPPARPARADRRVRRGRRRAAAVLVVGRATAG